MKKIINIAFLSLASLLVGCFASSEHENLNSAAYDFAVAYFNYDLHQALELSTPESQKWIRYIASNIEEEDVEVLRAQDRGASVNIKNLEFGDDKTTATAEIEVSYYMQMDTIGRPGHIVDEATFIIPFKKQGPSWLADLNIHCLKPVK